MRPDSALIYFTVCSGTGYGMLVSLLTLYLNIEINISIYAKFIIIGVSFFLITSGLISSTLHLGHPERVWRALSQWRSSWLSREGIAAIITFIPFALFCFFWVFTNFILITFIILFITSIFSQITTFCTAKIYSSIKAIPAWNNSYVPIIYILNSITLGSIFTFTILFNFEIEIIILSNLIIAISIISLLIKILYWISIKKTSKSNIATATGLGTKDKTSFFEGPHTGKNFLTEEMINNIKNSKAFLLRLAVCIFTYITPAYYVSQQPFLIISDYTTSITLILICIIATIGMFFERYLFFIESKHTVSLFYGNQKI